MGAGGARFPLRGLTCNVRNPQGGRDASDRTDSAGEKRGRSGPRRAAPDAIVDSQFAMGENISEERLTALFGVSRSPVRDALNALKFIGLVEILPKRGSFVFLPGAAGSPTCANSASCWNARRRCWPWPRPRCAGRPAGRDLPAHDAGRGCRRSRRLLCPRRHRLSWRSFEFCGNRLVCDAYALAAHRHRLRTALTARPRTRLRQASFREHQEIAALAAATWTAFAPRFG